jgi:nicotinate-nucleotide adenylyltransferase
MGNVGRRHPDHSLKKPKLCCPSKRGGRPSPDKSIRVGLLGGSFNPAHMGHIHISVQALQTLRLDEVWWLVSPQNPLKSVEGMAPLSKRVAKANKIVDHPKVKIYALENLLGTRYTCNSLRLLHQLYPKITFFWLMGADNLADFHNWRGWKNIVNKTYIAVFARQTYDLKALAGKMAFQYRSAKITAGQMRQSGLIRPPAWVFLHLRKHPASATALRRQGFKF